MAHYLTFNNSTSGVVDVRVNGTSVSSGYELHNGDVIEVIDSGSAGSATCIYNLQSYSMVRIGNINVSDEDIILLITLPTSGGGSDI